MTDTLTGTHKTCPDCGWTKPLSDFTKRAVSKDGHAGQCKPCYNARVQAWRDRNRDKVNAAARRYRSTPDGKKYQADLARRKNITRYGITVEQYAEMLASQGGKCLLCEAREADSLKRRLHVDHDHDTGKVRGLLCSSCNIGIGKFCDNPERLRKAADYLERNQ